MSFVAVVLFPVLVVLQKKYKKKKKKDTVERYTGIFINLSNEVRDVAVLRGCYGYRCYVGCQYARACWVTQSSSCCRRLLSQ